MKIFKTIVSTIALIAIIVMAFLEKNIPMTVYWILWWVVFGASKDDVIEAICKLDLSKIMTWKK